MADGYIYSLTNIVNGKMYIGMTLRSVEQRWLEHVSRSRNPDKYKSKIHAALRKYGAENFKVETLVCCSNVDNLKRLEMDLIEQYNTYNKGYNLTPGGDYKEVSPEVKAKISMSKQGHEVTDETRHKLSLHNRRTWRVVYEDSSEVLVSNIRYGFNLTNTQYNNLLRRKKLKKLGIKHVEKVGTF